MGVSFKRADSTLVDEVLAVDPVNVQANWYKLLCLFEDRKVSRNDENFDFNQLCTPEAIRAYAVVGDKAPHFFKRRILRRIIDNSSTASCFVQALCSPIWEEISNGATLRQVCMKALLDAIQISGSIKLKKLILARPIFAELLNISTENDKPQVQHLMVQHVAVSAPDEVLSLASLLGSSNLTVLSLSFMKNLPNFDFLKNLAQLKRLHLNGSSVTTEQVAMLPSCCPATLTGLHLDGIQLDSAELVIPCLTGMPAVTSFGLPSFSPQSTAQTLCEFWKPLLPHISHLKIISARQMELDRSFGAAVVELCAAAPAVQIIDTFLSHGDGDTPCSEYATLSHMNLLAVVLSSGEIVAYSGPRTVVLTVSQSRPGYLVLDISSNKGDCSALAEFVESHPELEYSPQWDDSVVREKTRLVQVAFPLGTIGLTLNVARVGKFKSNKLMCRRMPEIRVVENFGRELFCSASLPNPNMAVFIGSRRYQFSKTQIELKSFTFAQDGKEQASFRYVQYGGIPITISPATCISAYAIAIGLILGNLGK
jgi:hypothetical protein